MSEPDWDRWHDLLDIRDGRGFTDAEQAEYAAFLPIVAKLDQAEADRCEKWVNERIRDWAKR